MARVIRFPFIRFNNYLGSYRLLPSTKASLPILESMEFGAASGGTSATANGQLLSYSLSFIAGAANGQSNATANGVVYTVGYTLIFGSASISQGGTANGAVLPLGYSLTVGAGQGQQNVTAPGQTLPLGYSLLSGSAQGQRNATASGVTFTLGYALLSGNAQGQGNASAGGATLLQGYSLLQGAASATVNGLASGTIFTLGYSLISGLASAVSSSPVIAGGGYVTRARPIILVSRETEKVERAVAKVIKAAEPKQERDTKRIQATLQAVKDAARRDDAIKARQEADRLDSLLTKLRVDIELAEQARYALDQLMAIFQIETEIEIGISEDDAMMAFLLLA